MHRGRQREYLIHLPRTAGPAIEKELPVVFAFHGGGGNANGFDDIARMSATADRFGFAVVYPQGVDRQWNDGKPETDFGVDDIGFFDVLLARIIKELPVDSKRVYVNGMSNGGLFAFRLACERAEKLAAVATVVANLGLTTSRTCRPARAVPLFAVFGDADPLMPFRGGEITGPFGLVKRGAVLSADETLRFWARINGCAMNGKNIKTISCDGMTVAVDGWDKCSGAKLRRAIVHGGGHTWPGGKPYLAERMIGRTCQAYDETSEIFQFFRDAR